MSKFFEAASKLNPLLVDSILAELPAPLPEVPVSQPAAPPAVAVGVAVAPEPAERGAVEPPAGNKAAIPHAGEFSVHDIPASPVLPFHGDTEDAAEGYKILRTKILQHPKQPKVVCVTSAITGDGKSITAINLAGVLGLKEHTRVLLLDCDLRHPTIHSLLGVPDEFPGAAEVLAGKATWLRAIVRCKEFPNLYVLPAGKSHGRAAELLDSNAWRAGCKHLRTIFDYVIVDSPPLGMVTDYDLIQDSCDGVVIVARPNHTDRTSFNKLLQTIGPERNLGVVLNCTERWFLWRTQHDYRYAYTDRSSKRATQRQRG